MAHMSPDLHRTIVGAERGLLKKVNQSGPYVVLSVGGMRSPQAPRSVGSALTEADATSVRLTVQARGLQSWMFLATSPFFDTS